MILAISGNDIVLMLKNWNEVWGTKKFVDIVLSYVQKDIINNNIELEKASLHASHYWFEK